MFEIFYNFKYKIEGDDKYKMFNKINNPVNFQGSLKSSNYFEGWYFKQVSLNSEKIISFIPGVSLNKDDSHSFVQVIESPPVKTHYFKYDVDNFSVGKDPFYVKIGDNFFSEKKVEIDLINENTHIYGKLEYGTFQKIESSLFTPNIMGVFAYIPKMDCNHGVISMNHKVNGKIVANNKEIIFTEDKGYLEKDWGRSFPKRYIWLQGNNFYNYKDSFMCSIASVPLLGLTFTGLIANLHVDDKEYRFATYNGASIKRVSTREDGVDITLKKGNMTLSICAYMNESGELKAPINGKMSDTIKEGLNGKIELTLYKGDEKYKQIETNYAGIEIVGQYNSK